MSKLPYDPTRDFSPDPSPGYGQSYQTKQVPGHYTSSISQPPAPLSATSSGTWRSSNPTPAHQSPHGPAQWQSSQSPYGLASQRPYEPTIQSSEPLHHACGCSVIERDRDLRLFCGQCTEVQIAFIKRKYAREIAKTADLWRKAKTRDPYSKVLGELDTEREELVGRRDAETAKVRSIYPLSTDWTAQHVCGHPVVDCDRAICRRCGQCVEGYVKEVCDRYDTKIELLAKEIELAAAGLERHKLRQRRDDALKEKEWKIKHIHDWDVQGQT